jgi:hypothetical protein
LGEKFIFAGLRLYVGQIAQRGNTNSRSRRSRAVGDREVNREKAVNPKQLKRDIEEVTRRVMANGGCKTAAEAIALFGSDDEETPEAEELSKEDRQWLRDNLERYGRVETHLKKEYRKDSKFEDIALLNKPQPWAPWPIFFNEAILEYSAIPNGFWLALLRIWSECAGGESGVFGRVALSQLRGNNRDKNKWLIALIETGFFERKAAALGDQEGSIFFLNQKRDKEDWWRFFRILNLACLTGGFNETITTEKFGQIIRDSVAEANKRWNSVNEGTADTSRPEAGSEGT